MLRWPQLLPVLGSNIRRGECRGLRSQQSRSGGESLPPLPIQPHSSLPVSAPRNSYSGRRSRFGLVEVWVGRELSFEILALSHLLCQELALLGFNFGCCTSWYRSLPTWEERVCLWLCTRCAFVYFYICILHSNRDFMHRTKLFPPISLGLSFCWIIQLLCGLHGLLLDKFTTLSFPFHWNF